MSNLPKIPNSSDRVRRTKADEKGADAHSLRIRTGYNSQLYEKNPQSVSAYRMMVASRSGLTLTMLIGVASFCSR